MTNTAAALADLHPDAPAGDLLAALRGVDEALLAELTGDLLTHTRAVLAAIHADMTAGHHPADIGSFTALHDRVDANEYVITALEGAFPVPEHYGDEYADGSKLNTQDQATVDAETDMANAVMDQVDRILAVEAEALRSALPGRFPRPAGETRPGTAWVVVTFPDTEAAQAARISGVAVHAARPDADPDELVFEVKANLLVIPDEAALTDTEPADEAGAR
jgi:hypothetical protein